MLKNIPVMEQPREKALQYGLSSLSNRELLALQLRTGYRHHSALEVADEILARADGISGLPRLSRQELIQIPGISQIKALELLAIFEIVRRSSAAKLPTLPRVQHPSILFDWLKQEIGTSLQEKFLVVFLASDQRVLSYKILFVGTINASMVFPREIFKEALLLNSPNIILVHNHPSGNLSPSQEDISLTKRIKEAGQLMGVKVLDHIIVTQSDYFSFVQEGIE